MRVYVWTMVLLIVLTVCTQIFWLGVGRIQQRTPASVAVDLFINMALVCWGIVLLFA